MDRRFIARHWYADVYERFENQTDDVEFFLKLLRDQTGGTPQNILEVACGGGRISVPLARAGHRVTGFDSDEYMLLHCYRRMRDLPNMTCYQADATMSDWGEDFDIVVMAGNVLMNIKSDMDYAEAQESFIRKAAAALHSGGHLLIDYDLHSDSSASSFFNRSGESSYFKGTDDLGTRGKTMSYGSVYNPVTRVCAGANHFDLTANNGQRIILSEVWHKHIPSQEQVSAWLTSAGFTVEKTYRNYTVEPLDQRESGHVRATIWARKG